MTQATPRNRRSLVGLSTVLFLVLSFNSTPSVPSVPGQLPTPPSAGEIRDLEEVARWVTVGRAAVRPAELVTALREGRRSFDLFRTYTPPEAHARVLAGVPFGREIARAAERHGLDGLLVAAVVEVESGFHPGAVSPMGAMGLMQVMPTTGELYGQTDLLDPRKNLDAGSRYIAYLLDYFSGDLELALAGYNAGPGNVTRFGGVPPFPETHSYVKKVVMAWFENHRRVWHASGAAEQFRLR